MRGLWARLLLALTVPTFIGLALADVAFLFFGQAELVRARRLELRLALAEVATRDLTDDPTAAVRAIAGAHDVALTLVRQDGTSVASEPVPLPELAATGEILAEGRLEQAVLPLAHGDFRWAVASRARDDVLGAVFRDQPRALGILAVVGAVIVGFGLLFLRRSVLRPLARMTDLVDRRDQEALSRLEAIGASDGLSRLGRAILAMTQKIADDKAHIAQQLEELVRRNRELAATQAELVRAERLAVVGQLAAGIAHEIGNPLAILAGFLDVLEDPGLPSEQRQEARRRMGHELGRIHATVRSLLDFSRASQSADAKGDLSAALAHVQSLLAPQERLRGVTLAVPALAEPIEVPLATDALTQVLVNLLLNAADALDHRGRVAVSVAAGAREVVLCVDDSGPGIPPELRARVFEPFFTTKPAGSGTGLGLAVCERIVTAAGGDIRAEESPLGGARFRVTLPRAAQLSTTRSSSTTSA